MAIKVDYEDLFKQKLESGINLFTGAGFSVLKDKNGNGLPDAKTLCKELYVRFNIEDDYGDDLESLSSIIEANAEQQYQEFLRKRFMVTDYNEKYEVLDSINIKSYITTNIDNMLECVMDNSSRYYFRNLTHYGAPKSAPNEIEYIPLHGSVSDSESHLYFGKFDLAMVNEYNRDLFELAFSQLKKQPTLFWGYGFHDDGVKKTIARILKNNTNDIWIQCRKEGPESKLYKALGCHIIIGDTEELLDWIRDNIKSKSLPSAVKISEELRQYLVPTINQVLAIPREEYFKNSETNWYNVIAGHTYSGSVVTDIENLSINVKNIIIDGISFTGKTTLLMQLALKIDSPYKFYIKDLTPNFAKFIISKTKKCSKVIIFIDECADDIEAYALLARANNIHTIAVTETFAFESSKHLLEGVKYKKIDVEELTRIEAQAIYDKIPLSIRNDNFVYKDTEDEKFGMLEMMSKNVKELISEDKVEKILLIAKKNNYRVFEIIAITTYMNINKSAASLDIFISYFGNDYELICKDIDEANSILSDKVIVEDEFDNCYYSLRSHLFAYLASKKLCTTYKQDYQRIINKFILCVKTFTIYRYDVFRRSAYDAEFFFRLYGDKANPLYEHIYKYDGNAYTLQQWALYKAKIGDYKGAFSSIDNALTMKPHNFSIQNTHAIILFEANKQYDTKEAKLELKNAMEILSRCYMSDKRKVYHAQKYAEFALILANEQNNYKYINVAIEWIDKIISSGESRTWKTFNLQKDLKRVSKKFDLNSEE